MGKVRRGGVEGGGADKFRNVSAYVSKEEGVKIERKKRRRWDTKIGNATFLLNERVTKWCGPA